MTIIWRVENERGVGPYNYSAHDSFIQFGQKDYHPGPSSCPVLSHRWLTGSSNDVFGFATVEDYLSWFRKDRWRQWLADRGFWLREFDITHNDIAFGDRQVIFNRNLSNLLRSHSPLAFGQALAFPQ